MSVADYPTLPFARPNILDIAPRYLKLQAEQPVARVRTLTGDLAWLITRHDYVRMLLAHPALRRSHPDPEHAAQFSNAPLLGGPVGSNDTEKADHTRMRVAMAKSFSPRRVQQLRSRVQSVVDELLDHLERHPRGSVPTVDLHQALCLPVPVNVICEVLGIPYEDRHDFRVWVDGAIRLGDPAHAVESIEHLSVYMRRLIDEKRRRPGEDAISDMIEADRQGGLTEQEVVQFAVILLIAGHETTVARLASACCCCSPILNRAAGCVMIRPSSSEPSKRFCA